ncbi:hypothetical protein Taro_021135 [Colocasia esculenta]|uniref:Uncharacterized protein n=1 Tax=Colocasia esculenta TaxID=4460 RepID=A0A843V0J8_COLES|nr:hypothetical protein [Colocasia esculenta]
MAAFIISGNLGGCSAEFLCPEQQERFTSIKTKLCGNKAIDIADLEKNGMHSVVAAIIRMQWMGISTLSEVSYPDLVKAFFVCLKSEADGSLTSFVNGTQIRIDRDILKTLFGVCTSGHSGIHTVDIQAKGLGIIGPDFRLKDGKLDVNQLNAFNKILHFIGEQSQKEPAEAAHCDEPMGSVPADEDLPNSPDDVRDGETASSSDSNNDQQPPASEARKKGKEVDSGVPLLSDTPFERQMRQKIVINLKPVIERLDAQGTILCSLQSDVSSIFMSQASASKEISGIRNAMKWFNKEMGSMKSMLSEILKAVGAPAPSPPTPPVDQGLGANSPRPSGPSAQESGPSGPAPAATEAKVNVQGPSGPAEQGEGSPGPAEQESGSSGPLESEPVQTGVEEEILAPTPPAPSPSSLTPVPPSPPSAPTSPPTPQPFKEPQSKPISPPTPFPSQSTSSPASSTHILPPPPISEVPPASSTGASSSSGPSPGPVDFATLPVPDEIALPQIHFLVMESSVGSIIFKCFARVMGRIKVQKGCLVAFPRFLFREYDQGHVSAEVLAPVLSECERLTSSEWRRFYPLSAQQLLTLNEAQAREGKSAVSPASFLDMNSIHLVNDPFKVWDESVKEDLVGSRLLFPFGCEGRPGVVSRVLFFPSGVKEDQLSWVL